MPNFGEFPFYALQWIKARWKKFIAVSPLSLHYKVRSSKKKDRRHGGGIYK
jgi:hypothetical protein